MSRNIPGYTEVQTKSNIHVLYSSLMCALEKFSKTTWTFIWDSEGNTVPKRDLKYSEKK